MSQRIRIKLKSYDYNLVDKSAEKIVKTVKSTGAVVSGPIPLPTEKHQLFLQKHCGCRASVCMRITGIAHALFYLREVIATQYISAFQ